ncbi:VOC family protein [Thalassobius vesicularis]|uniref:VOC family protein n=1 Tax=Thalassobius vesicularis TaxID=1294297 RepID=A0A4S3M792_9RHOB|nr:VOC family protein [Thalassobius vesicularis]THD73033.1 VOC family protein [Thalassobius vesicularis]
MSFDPYIHFPGTCAEAMQFYADIFGGELAVMPYAAAPEGQAPEMPHDPSRVMHACLLLDGRMLLASDYPSAEMDQPQASVSISHECTDRPTAAALFDKLAEGAQMVMMPFGDVFWCDGFGMMTDRFGTTWMISGPSTM